MCTLVDSSSLQLRPLRRNHVICCELFVHPINTNPPLNTSLKQPNSIDSLATSGISASSPESSTPGSIANPQIFWKRVRLNESQADGSDRKEYIFKIM